MNSLLFFAGLLAYASAAIIVPSVIPTVQYHGQDYAGGYSYSYATPGMETKTEVRQVDGTVIGGYKYLDGYGQVQHVEYKADPKLGFHVAATNLPIAHIQDTPEVAFAKKEHLKAVELAKMQHEHLVVPQVGYSHFVQPVITKGVDMGLDYTEHVKNKEMIESAEVAKAKEEHLKAVEKELMLQKQQEKLMNEAKLKMNVKSDIYSPVHTLKSDYVPVVKTQPIFPIVKSNYVPLVKSESYVPIVKSDYVPYVKSEPVVPYIKSDILSVVKTEPVVPLVKSDVVSVVKTEPIVPIVKSVLPVVKSDVLSHQYHSQDEMGRFAYSYDDINSAKVETGVAGQDVSGQYSYIDANSKLQTVRYVADDQGFRVAATNLPVHDVISGDSLMNDANKYQIAYY